jgi:hypothetical protein
VLSYRTNGRAVVRPSSCEAMRAAQKDAETPADLCHPHWPNSCSGARRGRKRRRRHYEERTKPVGCNRRRGDRYFGTFVCARSIGAYAGHSLDPHQANLFGESNWGEVEGLIAPGSSAGWEVYLPVDAAGTYAPTVWVANPVGGGISCGAAAVSADGATVSYSGSVSIGTGSMVHLTLNSVTVPVTSGGYVGFLYAGCYMGNGSLWQSVQW